MNNFIPSDVEKDILLSHFTMENLQEAIYWIDDKANIIQVNEAACKASGYSKAELLKMAVFDLNPSENIKHWPEHWKTVKKDKKVTFESVHKHKDGSLYPVEITNNYIEYDGMEFSFIILKEY